MNIHNNIRIIQLSDCHLSSDNTQQWFGRNPDSYLERLIQYINDNEKNDSLILATGDLSHDGSKESYTKLSNYFSSLDKDVYTLAGNHDDVDHMDKYLNQGRISSAAFFTQGNWLILMLNTPEPKQEYGLLSKQDLIQANSLLEQHKDKHVLVAMHHPPVKVGCAWIDNLNLRNSHDFMTLVSQHNNIKTICFGHVHQDHKMVIDNIQYFSCPSTCHQYLGNSDDFAIDNINAGYRWFNLSHDGNVSSGVTRLPSNIHAS